MSRVPRRPPAPAARLASPPPAAILPERRRGPPRLSPADIVQCFRLARSGNRQHALTVQFRDGRVVRIRLTAAFLRPLRRAFAAAQRHAPGPATGAGPPAGCRCAGEALECIPQGIHVHGLRDGVVVSFDCTDAVCHAAFDGPLARDLARDLRRLGALSPSPG